MMKHVSIGKPVEIRASARVKGFTLIEMSIVLVIIGLIGGGILIGQDLIRAAEVRATVSQIEKYHGAVNTFREKYGALPGDLNAQVANQFGFVQRGQFAGEGDGNGVIQGVMADAAGFNGGQYEATGETAMFWVDLSTAKLIEGSFILASPNVSPAADLSTTQLDGYYPAAKLVKGNHVFVYSGGVAGTADYTNFFEIQSVTSVTTFGQSSGNPNLSVQQAYSIDMKIDDGLPQSGTVRALYLFSALILWDGSSTTAATPGSASTCYDNSSSPIGTPGINGAVQHYSVEINNGANTTCALSIRFQ